eukprot:6029388-Prymnesium_polylepis.2
MRNQQHCPFQPFCRMRTESMIDGGRLGEHTRAVSCGAIPLDNKDMEGHCSLCVIRAGVCTSVLL